MNRKQVKSNQRRKANTHKKAFLSFLLFAVISGCTGYFSGLLTSAHDAEATYSSEALYAASPVQMNKQEKQKTAKTAIPQKTYKTIEIQKGDTLWSIAETYMPEDCESVEAYIAELRKLNSLQSDELYSSCYLMVSCLE